jgi:hypothetical protein
MVRAALTHQFFAGSRKFDNQMPVNQAKLNRIADWLTLLAAPGMLFFVLTVAYDIYAFRTNPKSPDATHFIERVEHGDHRFFTPLQAKITSHPLMGFAEAFVLLAIASFLRNGCKFNKLGSKKS